jgi:hypothetical protein
VRVRPTWIRYSDYNVAPPQIVEFQAKQLVGWTSTLGSPAAEQALAANGSL